MNHWPFIITAYALTIAGTGGLAFWSALHMRRAEARAKKLTERA